MAADWNVNRSTDNNFENNNFKNMNNMSNMNKSPPLLSKSESYDDWLKLVEIWHKFTTLEPEKQGPAIVLSLKCKAQDAVLELDTSQISHTDGVTIIIDRLNKIYKKDELTQCFRGF